MSGNGQSPRRLDLSAAAAGRRRAEMVAGMRTFARATAAPRAPEPVVAVTSERCDLCEGVMPEDHRHLLNLVERQIACVCESCFAIRSGDPELRPVGNRTLWLEGFELPEEVWASFQIPIGLAFFMHSSVTDCVVALYPSPAGATESELHFDTWRELRALNPVLDELELDAEALIVNRLSDPPSYAIAPIDRAYMLVGLVKSRWEGISGGSGLESAVAGFFDELRATGAPA